MRGIARRAAGGILALSAVLAPAHTLASDATMVGQWSAPIAWPAVGVHAMLLADGDVMTWGHETAPVVYDPTTQAISRVPNPFANPVCGGANTLADGRLVTVGGGGLAGPGITTMTSYTASAGTWAQLAPTNYTTWYASTTVMGDGTLLRVGGVDGCDNCSPENPERYDPATNTWSILSGATALLPMYPFTFLRPDGTVAITGASQLPSPLRILDPVRQAWSVSDPVVVDGASPAMYDVGRVIKAGASADSGDSGPASASAYVTDLAAVSPHWTRTGSMAYPRSFTNLTALPDGTVLATGGETTRDGNTPANAVYAAEDWSPSTGAWTTWAAEATARLYHSTAILLPDGRVFVSGGGDDPSALVPDNETSEIFSPPYLFRGPRPTIDASPAQVGYGSTFTVATPDAGAIASVSLIRVGNTTHFFDQSARRVPLSFTAGSGTLTVAAPGAGNTAPPGSYLLFVVNGAGVPSVARIVQVGSAAPPPPPPPGPLVGSATVQAARDTDSPGQAEALQFAATAGGTVHSLSAYLDQANGAATVDVGLYADAGGHPGALLTRGEIAAPVGDAWNTVTVPPVQVAPGTAYWLALLGPAGTGAIAFRDVASGGGPAETSAQGDLARLPDTWSSGAAYQNSPASIAALGTVGPSPGPTPTPSPTPTANPALLGLTAVQPAADTDAAGQAEAFEYTAGATGAAHSAAFYLDGSSTAAQVVVGVYADGGGAPGQLLGAATASSPRAGAWNTAPVAVSVMAGQRYWLAILQPAGTAGILAFRDGGAGSSQGSASSSLTTLPATYATGAIWPSGQMSAYLS